MARLLPDTIAIISAEGFIFVWRERMGKGASAFTNPILETEWLYVMHLVEQTLSLQLKQHAYSERNQYVNLLMIECGEYGAVIATFNQRATAMCKVKGISC